MELFNEEFVHFVGDDELKGKEVFYADEIDDLIKEVNGETTVNAFGKKILHDKSCSYRFPFQMDKDDKEDCYRFVYYDPNYDVKAAYLNGETVQYRYLPNDNIISSGKWNDVLNLSDISYFDNYNREYRIKPEENQKWWVMPKYNIFSSEAHLFGQSYIVEKQEKSYSRSRPPLKSNFESKEKAEKWLKEYLKEESLFDDAKNDVENLACNLGHIVEKLQRHEFITKNDWDSCFALFDSSKIEGSLKQVTKG